MAKPKVSMPTVVAMVARYVFMVGLLFVFCCRSQSVCVGDADRGWIEEIHLGFSSGKEPDPGVFQGCHPHCAAAFLRFTIR